MCFSLHYPILGRIFAVKEEVYQNVIVFALDVMSIITVEFKSRQYNG